MIRKLLRIGDARLLQVAAPVELYGTPVLHKLAVDLRDTVRAQMGLGLAAPQIGVPLRVMAVKEPGGPAAVAVFVNPVLTPLSQEMCSGREACLSVPGRWGNVPRYVRVRLEAFDLAGRPIVRELQDVPARVVQHECDHLDGILYPARMVGVAEQGASS